MTTAALKKLNKQNNIEASEFDNVSKLLFNSFLLENDKAKQSELDKKEELIIQFTQLLEKYLELQFLDSKKDKLELINFIDKMNLQKELLEIQRGEISISQIKKAANTLGDKSQSSFSTRRGNASKKTTKINR